MKYSKGSYNKLDNKEQWIRLSEGCPNNCEYCRETKECGTKPVYFKIPKIKRNKVKILDMNLIYKPKALELIDKLGTIRVDSKVVYYELICGIDFRFLTKELAEALKKARFKNIRIAWDFGLEYQFKLKDCIKLLIKAGFRAKEISCFIICNWKITFKENLTKLDLCKVWNVKVNDCWYDNQLSPNIKPIYWTEKQIKSFRRKCRKHNHYVLFGCDPEFKKL